LMRIRFRIQLITLIRIRIHNTGKTAFWQKCRKSSKNLVPIGSGHANFYQLMWGKRPKFRPLSSNSHKIALLPWRACRECPAGSWRGLPGPRAPCHGGDPAHTQSCARCHAQNRSHICNDASIM
jgi:hypothetical protein